MEIFCFHVLYRSNTYLDSTFRAKIKRIVPLSPLHRTPASKIYAKKYMKFAHVRFSRLIRSWVPQFDINHHFVNTKKWAEWIEICLSRINRERKTNELLDGPNYKFGKNNRKILSNVPGERVCSDSSYPRKLTCANFTYFLAYILVTGVRWRGETGAMRLVFARKVESKYVLERYKTRKQNISTRWC